jgi:O-antigen/teichoic acid export membrane protein
MAPFTAIIVAHEDMQIYAYVSIAEVVMQLCILFFITHLSGDNLIAYGFFLFIVSVITASIYMITSLKKYDECQFRKFYWDKSLLKEISNFTGWTLFGQVTTMFRNQAITILLNQFFNPVVVAARAVAVSISGRINVFSMNFSIGLYPSIIKSYAAGDKKQMFSLIFNGSKITFFLMWVFALPMLLEMEFLLNIWLKNVPQEAVLFTRLGIIEILINSGSLPLTTAARAPGKMKIYELVLGSIQLLIFVTAWIILKMGYDAYSVFVVAIIANVVMFIARLIIVKNLIALPIKSFVSQVIRPALVITILSLSPSLTLQSLLPRGLLYSGLIIIISMLLASLAMYFIGLNKAWRMKVRNLLHIKIYALLYKSRKE